MSVPPPPPKNDREAVQRLIGEIRDLYKEIIKLRANDRELYRQLSDRVNAIEQDKSKRFMKNRRKYKLEEKNKLKNASANPGNAPKKTPSKNSKIDSASNEPDEKGAEKEE
ncbi:hypothetical protein CRE_11405 [Caenorhabditis remanei]|uniref:Uncharacterized protein n=1 Tax=Caenorhabditis remanei TaxID=31234 RepID=E3N745_CAERE|nr:hypothetical protein CRE_11405 [Caenorhabditis remanei]